MDPMTTFVLQSSFLLPQEALWLRYLVEDCGTRSRKGGCINRLVALVESVAIPVVAGLNGLGSIVNLTRDIAALGGNGVYRLGRLLGWDARLQDWLPLLRSVAQDLLSIAQYLACVVVGTLMALVGLIPLAWTLRFYVKPKPPLHGFYVKRQPQPLSRTLDGTLLVATTKIADVEVPNDIVRQIVTKLIDNIKNNNQKPVFIEAQTDRNPLLDLLRFGETCKSFYQITRVMLSFHFVQKRIFQQLFQNERFIPAKPLNKEQTEIFIDYPDFKDSMETTPELLSLILHVESLKDERGDYALPHLPSGLAMLALTGTRDAEIGDAAAAALAPNLPSSLTTLNLSENDLGPDGARALAQKLASCSLKNLNLRWNDIGAAGARALADKLPSCSLTTLDLSGNGLRCDGVAALPAVLSSCSLITLDLSLNHVGPDGARALADKLPSCSLKNLNLRWNDIGAAGARALADKLPSCSLTTLDLSGNSLRRDGAAALAAVLSSCSLTTLDLSNNDLGPDGAAAFALAAGLPSSLTSLNLGGNLIGAAGARALAGKLSSFSLTTLDLRHNDLGPDGAAGLAASLPSSLTTLNLNLNNIGHAGAIALAAHIPSSLTNLDLSSNGIGPEGAAALAAALPSSLTKLDLSWDHIGAVGARALAEKLSSSSLTTLNLCSTCIGAAGAAVLAEKLSSSSLTALDLSENGMGDAGAAALAANLPSSLTLLDLRHNGIGAAVLNEMRLAHPQLRIIHESDGA